MNKIVSLSFPQNVDPIIFQEKEKEREKRVNITLKENYK